MGKIGRAMSILLFLCLAVSMTFAMGTGDGAAAGKGELKPATSTWVAGGMGDG